MTFQSIRSNIIRQIVSIRGQRPVKSLTRLFTLILAILIIAGCGKSPSSPPTADVQPSTIHHPPSAPSLSLHWLGKKRLAADTSATNFISIWNMPESLRLENQTLDKLSTAPWRLIQGITPLSNAPVALLRAMLDDVVQYETYLEYTAHTNRLPEALFAIKLPPDRATFWATNLPVVLDSILANSKTTPQTPDPRPQTPNLTLQPAVTNIGEWTVLSIAPPINNQLSTINILSRLTATNHLISGDIDCVWLKRVLGLRTADDSALPKVNFSVIGTGAAIRTTAKFNFSTNAPIKLEPWNIPTNLVHDPLNGFMAIRGFRPLLQSFGLWDEGKLGDTPNQALFWAQNGNPALRFFALPSHRSGNQLDLFSKFLLNEVNPIMAVFPNTTNVPIGSFEQVPGSQRLKWRGIPYIMPNLDVINLDSNVFITGGLFANRITNSPAPDSLLAQFRTDSDILLYDWESSQATSYALIQISQTARFVFGLNRLSITNNPALPWIVAISPKLATSGTTIRLSSPTSVSFTRSSTIGLTGLEIHLLAEWLESPDFPQGLFSTRSSSKR